jgi:hypothetical protein
MSVSEACRRGFGPILDPTRRWSRALHRLRHGDNAGGLGTEAAGANRQSAKYEFGDLHSSDTSFCTVAAGAQALSQSTGEISRLRSMNVRASKRACSGHFSRRTTRTEAHLTFAGIRPVGDRLFVQKPPEVPPALRGDRHRGGPHRVHERRVQQLGTRTRNTTPESTVGATTCQFISMPYPRRAYLPRTQ